MPITIMRSILTTMEKYGRTGDSNSDYDGEDEGRDGVGVDEKYKQKTDEKRFPKTGTEKHDKNVWEFDSSRKYQKRTCELKKSTLWGFGRGPKIQLRLPCGKHRGQTCGKHRLFYANAGVREGAASDMSYDQRTCPMNIGLVL